MHSIMQVTRRELDTVRNCKTLVHKLLNRVRGVRKASHALQWTHRMFSVVCSLSSACSGCRQILILSPVVTLCELLS